ncbi:MAG: YihY/virulence factor BrkB family protein [Acidobacteria bacterium]|nr:YihY/virulence factor BrkB family protein [Acidobacteriota bacterium]
MIETLDAWNRDDASKWAAALAFYAVFSLAPTLAIVVRIAGIAFGAEAARGEVVLQSRQLLGARSARFVEDLITDAAGGSSVVTLVEVAVMAFAATVVFSVLQDALNAIWNVRAKPGRWLRLFFKKRVLSFALVAGIGLLLLTSLIITAVLSAADAYLAQIQISSSVLQGANFLLSFAVTTFLFAVIYKVLPDAKIGWRDVWTGAAATSLLFTVGKMLIGIYLANSDLVSAHGAAASFAIFMLWIYFSAQTFFLGAELTQVYARRYGSGITPDANAMRIRAKGGASC